VEKMVDALDQLYRRLIPTPVNQSRQRVKS